VNQIAAGEVVERPASVVKELVENALDAGARAIRIVLGNGGRSLIEVSDDGCGMAAADALLALQRHATSKISLFDDLLSVSTLGFRGEALPSIASVSQFRLTTWDGREEHGVEIEPRLAAEPVVRPAARDRGTTVRVGELFENVPARRKFLRSTDGEFRAIVAIVSSYALAAPGCAFTLSHNGRNVLELPAADTSRERTLQVLGREAAAALEPIDGGTEGCRVSGFVTRGLRYGSRRNQFFFVNRRLVKDRVLAHAINRACDAFDFDGHPAVVLFLEIDPREVDVNVHPAKTEVRFRDSGRVHVAVESGVRRALGGAAEGASLLGPEPALAGLPLSLADGEGRLAGLPASTLSSHAFPAALPAPLAAPQPLFQQRPLVQPPREEERPDLGDLQGRVIGQYRLSYILLDTPGGLRLVDQHVAHERVLYDRISASIGTAAGSQQLLSSELFECGAAEAGLLESHLGELRSLGFDIERLSGSSFAIGAVAAHIGAGDAAPFLRKVIDAAADDRGSHFATMREKLIASLACQAAIKVHRSLGGVEMARLVEELLASSNPYACPHGRPIIVDIRHADIEKHFHRI
jgi:DNA mismatch repair protein MutL